jgi:hypothetical protein
MRYKEEYEPGCLAYVIIIVSFIIVAIGVRSLYGRVVYGDWRCGVADCRIVK